jgi:PhoH-like protein
MADEPYGTAMAETLRKAYPCPLCLRRSRLPIFSLLRSTIRETVRTREGPVSRRVCSWAGDLPTPTTPSLPSAHPQAALSRSRDLSISHSVGGAGTGKTHLATAIGVQAFEHHRKRVRFFSPSNSSVLSNKRSFRANPARSRRGSPTPISSSSTSSATRR